MSTLPETTLTWLNHAAEVGQGDAQVMLHLIAEVDQRDQAGAEFMDCYSRTIAALCRRLEALERGANLQRRDEDAEAAESDSVADTAHLAQGCHEYSGGHSGTQGEGPKTHPSQRQIDDLLAAISAAYSAQGWVPEADFICLFEEVARLAGIVEDGWDASVSPDDTRAKARAVLSRWGPPPAAAPAPGENLAAPPSPEPPAEALAARPLLEQVAAMADRPAIPTVDEITVISDRAAAWLRDNPPGQPVAIEPHGCPTPGACSCVEPTPPAPVPREVGPLWYLVEFLEGHSSFRRRTDPTDELAQILSESATLLQQQEAELATLRGVPVPVSEPLGDAPGGVTEGVTDEELKTLAWKIYVDARDGDHRGAIALRVCRAAIAADRARFVRPAIEPVSECPHCGYEGEMAPAPQAEEVEA
jgi:hypothetical protein